MVGRSSRTTPPSELRGGEREKRGREGEKRAASVRVVVMCVCSVRVSDHRSSGGDGGDGEEREREKKEQQRERCWSGEMPPDFSPAGSGRGWVRRRRDER